MAIRYISYEGRVPPSLPLDLREQEADRLLWKLDPNFARELGIAKPGRTPTQVDAVRLTGYTGPK
jgi:hypothetical protein